MENIKTVKDVLEACCHIPEGSSYPDTAICLSYGVMEDGKDMDLPEKNIFGNTNMRIAKTENFVHIDFVFKNRYDPRLDRMYKMLLQYQADVRELPEELFPSIQISLIPMCLKGRFQVVMADPEYFALCSENPMSYPHVISMLFEEEQVVLLELEEIDYNNIVADAKRQIDMQEFYEREEEKKRKQAAYESEFGFNKSTKAR